MCAKNIINDLLTPIGAFVKLGEFRPVFLFESVEQSGSAGRFSFIGLDPVETIVFDRLSGSRDGMIQTLRSALRKVKIFTEAERRIPAGLVGFSGFEALSSAGAGLPKNGLHDAVYVVPRVIIAFDHLEHSFSIVQTDQAETDEKLSEAIIAALRSESYPHPALAAVGKARIDPEIDELKDRIKEVKKCILNGEIHSTVMSVLLSGETELEPFQLYRAVRYLYPSPYLYYLNFADFHVLGSSPETLVRLERDQLTLKPLSGLWARRSDRSQNARTMQKLREDPVERAKHAILVDQAHNDCARLCGPGGVEFPRLSAVEQYSQDIHLVTQIRGTLRKEYDEFDAFAGVFPAGTLAGAPRDRAMEITARLEGAPRGLYGGSIGYFASNGTMDHAIAVRTFVVRDGGYSVRVGNIVTADSDPDALAESIMDKGRGILRAFDVAKECL